MAELRSSLKKVGSRFWLSIGVRGTAPMPTALIFASLLLSVLALIAGLFLGWQGLVSNVAANLVIVGPGLFISNVLIGTARERRLAAEIQPLLLVIVSVLKPLVGVARAAAEQAHLKIPDDSSDEPSNA